MSTINFEPICTRLNLNSDWGAELRSVPSAGLDRQQLRDRVLRKTIFFFKKFLFIICGFSYFSRLRLLKKCLEWHFQFFRGNLEWGT